MIDVQPLHAAWFVHKIWYYKEKYLQNNKDTNYNMIQNYIYRYRYTNIEQKLSRDLSRGF